MIKKILELAKNNPKISDLHLRAGTNIAYREMGDIVIEKNSRVESKDIEELLKKNCCESEIQIFNNKKELDSYVSGKDFEPSIDGITLLQDYIDASPKVITRVEFVNSKFLYAVEVDASEGFELCPACPEDQDEIPQQQIVGEFCPTTGNKFKILKNYKKNALIKNYEKFIALNGIEITGIEYIVDKNGTIYTYDINTNTNYNSQAEKSSKIKGMKSIAKFLKEELLLLNNIRVVA